LHVEGDVGEVGGDDLLDFAVNLFPFGAVERGVALDQQVVEVRIGVIAAVLAIGRVFCE
jgi:hypothetical protein